VLIRLQHKSSSNQDEERPKKRVCLWFEFIPASHLLDMQAKFSDNNSSPPVRRPVKPVSYQNFQWLNPVTEIFG
jgi:hypothetical protein